MRTAKQLLSLFLATLMVLAATGCQLVDPQSSTSGSTGSQLQEPPGSSTPSSSTDSSDAIDPSDTADPSSPTGGSVIPDPTDDPTVPDPSGDPDIPDPSGPVQPTEPVIPTVPVDPEPSTPEQPSEPVAPTVPEDPEPSIPEQPSEPVAPSVPENTEPSIPEQPSEPVVPSVPEETDPPMPPHTHSYAHTVVAPTCTADGYTQHTCSCGDSYTDTPTAATGHSYSETVVAATCSSDGYTLHSCSCGDSYTDSIVAATDHTWGEWTLNQEASMWWVGEESRSCKHCSTIEYRDIAMIPQDQFIVDVEAALVKYINQFRLAEASTEMTYLPGMSQVAKYRSVQLITNFAHDTTDEREAHAYYQYGRYVDFAEAGCQELVSQNYFTSDSGEAIGYGPYYGTAEQVAYKMASGVRASTGHWNYVGSSEYSYTGVGCTYEDGTWYICIMVGKVNYG